MYVSSCLLSYLSSFFFFYSYVLFFRFPLPSFLPCFLSLFIYSFSSFLFITFLFPSSILCLSLPLSFIHCSFHQKPAASLLRLFFTPFLSLFPFTFFISAPSLFPHSFTLPLSLFLPPLFHSSLSLYFALCLSLPSFSPLFTVHSSYPPSFLLSFTSKYKHKLSQNSYHSFLTVKERESKKKKKNPPV